MKSQDLGLHTHHQFDAELEEVRAKVLQMGGLVERQLKDALEALVNCDAAAAEQVVLNDYQVNAMEVDIDEECTQILALRQPTAKDLRLVQAITKAIADLERIGDEAERIARFAMNLADKCLSPDQYVELEHLGKHVREMLHDSLDAFARMDVNVAIHLGREDKSVDKEYESVLRQTVTFMMEDPRYIPQCLDILWCARALERIGDRSCNIGEYVIYFVRGKNVRHTTLEEMEREARG
ncbi:MAG: phosphate signaling complex protein PhoU [Chromatiales bacterium]|nr:phosphate signaling complex protein PhoU [Chromatiales bacterium]